MSSCTASDAVVGFIVVISMLSVVVIVVVVVSTVVVEDGFSLDDMSVTAAVMSDELIATGGGLEVVVEDIVTIT